MIRLEFPDTSHKTEYLSMIEEWKSHEVPSSPGALFRGETFEEFLQLTKDDLEKGNRHGVPATLFFAVNEADGILGAIQIRHHINHPNLIEM
jgi:predicted acetyltransferase